jgi:Mn-dependent DtxR family transcriptional regulator
LLGVRRSAVSLVAGTLQKAGFIRYSRRGHIQLLDIAQIETGACECYQTV